MVEQRKGCRVQGHMIMFYKQNSVCSYLYGLLTHAQWIHAYCIIHVLCKINIQKSSNIEKKKLYNPPPQMRLKTSS